MTPASFHPKAAPVVVTSGFGWRWHPVTGGWKAHAGVDLAARQGTPVVAASGGVVSYAGWMRGYGLLIEVDRGDGLATRYGHLSRVVVSRGQSVLQGQEIGAVGATGIATGPHLHYEVRVNGQPVDPSPLLQGASLNGVRTSANTSIRHEKNSRGRLVMSDASTGYVERNIAPRMP
nr:M23 family metallopeptidase [Novosphingobium terrae]